MLTRYLSRTIVAGIAAAGVAPFLDVRPSRRT